MNESAKSSADWMTQCQGLVRSLAWQVHRKLPPQVDLEELVGWGQLGLAEAARDFDPQRGVQFATFAHYRIRGAILDGLAKMQWFNQADYWRGRYERLANEVLDADADGSGQVRSLEDDVRWLKGMSTALAVVYLSCRGRDDDDESDEGGWEDPAADSPVEATLTKELHGKLGELIDALPAESRQLIRAAYFEGLTLTEAGRRLGISKAWASRLHARALEQLARSLRAAQLVD